MLWIWMCLDRIDEEDGWKGWMGLDWNETGSEPTDTGNREEDDCSMLSLQEQTQG